ncbi:MAG: hypothetical protein ACP5G2_02915 [Candidatus Bipolaricaulaceae bacterium]
MAVGLAVTGGLALGAAVAARAVLTRATAERALPRLSPPLGCERCSGIPAAPCCGYPFP